MIISSLLSTGIISRLDHFLYLGVETLWLSPFYKSPQADFGYDVTDYKDVDPIFGTMEDFRELVKQCKHRGETRSSFPCDVNVCQILRIGY